MVNKTKRPYVFIDGMNIFVRNFMVNQELNSKSEPVGGTTGFIRFLNYINNTLAPAKIFIVWEAGGGSPRRKKLYPEYKANRAKGKDFQKLKTGAANMQDLLRFDEKNKVSQLALLYRILGTTPVCQVFIKNTEGDDVLGYLVKEKFQNVDAPKVIVSSDKDFYQLLDDDTVKIFDPAKKSFITGDTVLEKFNISARNFCLAKSLVGDNSDNIGGIPRVGFKTVSKRFTELSSTNKDVTIDDILVECQEKIASKSRVKAYKEILSGESIVRRNWKLMYLNSSTLSADQITKINYIVDNHKPVMDKLGMIKVLIANGINMSFDFDRFASGLRQNLLFS